MGNGFQKQLSEVKRFWEYVYGKAPQWGHPQNKGA
jgi:hypothetical protein